MAGGVRASASGPIEDECARRGIKLRRSGVHQSGPCPKPDCPSDDDGFSINTAKQIFRCRQCNPEGGDAIAMAMWLDDSKFNDTIEKLAKEPPPDKHKSNGAKAYGSANHA